MLGQGDLWILLQMSLNPDDGQLNFGSTAERINGPRMTEAQDETTFVLALNFYDTELTVSEDLRSAGFVEVPNRTAIAQTC